MSRRTKALATSFQFAVELIKSKIDTEQKFISTAPYELSGESLKEYLAFAYREGMKYGSQVSPKSAGRGSSLADGPGRPGAKSSEGKAEQRHSPGEPRIGGGSARQFIQRLDGQKGSRPVKDP